MNFPMKVSEDFDPAERAKFQMDMEREIEETKELQSESASDELDEFCGCCGDLACETLAFGTYACRI
mgnify:CR=1 FL=1